MSEEYWKVAPYGMNFTVMDRDGNYVVCKDTLFVGRNAASYMKQVAHAVCAYANAKGIRPPAPVVELPSAFGCKWAVKGGKAQCLYSDASQNTHGTADTIAWLRAMLAALEPEPVGPWVVVDDGVDLPYIGASDGRKIRPDGNSGWIDGWMGNKEEPLTPNYRRLAKALCAEANRIEAERKGGA